MFPITILWFVNKQRIFKKCEQLNENLQIRNKKLIIVYTSCVQNLETKLCAIEVKLSFDRLWLNTALPLLLFILSSWDLLYSFYAWNDSVENTHLALNVDIHYKILYIIMLGGQREYVGRWYVYCFDMCG